jgi:hypothetical protein
MPEAMARTVIGSRSVEELASQVLKRGRGLWIKARGGSMTPFLRDGDAAFVEPTNDVGVGDIICFESASGRLFLHRVVARRRARVVTRGDALTSADVIPRRRILGTVTAVERRGRIRRLDTRGARWGNRVIARLSPVVARLVHAAVEGRGLARAIVRG